MPGRDGTGPISRGAMSGRGLGIGVGYRCRRGFGKFNIVERAALTEKELLVKQKKLLESKIDIVSKRLENYNKMAIKCKSRESHKMFIV